MRRIAAGLAIKSSGSSSPPPSNSASGVGSVDKLHGSAMGSAMSVANKDEAPVVNRRRAFLQRRARELKKSEDKSFGRRTSSTMSSKSDEDSSGEDSDDSVELDEPEHADTMQKNDKRFRRFINECKKTVLKVQFSVGIAWGATIFVTCSTLLLVLYLGATNRAVDYAIEFQTTASSQVDNQIAALANAAECVLASNANALSRRWSAGMDTDIAFKHFYLSIKLHQSSSGINSYISSLVFTDNNSSFYGISILPNRTTIMVNSSMAYVDTYTLSESPTDILPQNIESPVRRRLPYERPWQSNPSGVSEAKNCLTWSPVIPWQDHFVISLSRNVIDDDSNHYGTLSAFLSLDFFRTELDLQLETIGIDGMHFALFDSNSTLVAATFPTPNVACSDNYCTGNDMLQLNSQNYVAYLSELNSLIGDSGLLSKAEASSKVTVGDAAYWIYWHQLHSFNSTGQWALVSFVPISVLARQTRDENKYVIATCVVLFLVGLFICYPVLRLILGPINAISNYIHYFFMRHNTGTNGQVDEDVYNLIAASRTRLRAVTSKITEVRHLQQLFYRLRVLLAVFNKFLPQRVSQQLMRNDPSVTKLHVDRKPVALLVLEVAKFDEFLANEDTTVEMISSVQAVLFSVIVSNIAGGDGVITEMNESSISCFFEAGEDKGKAAAAALEAAIGIQRDLEKEVHPALKAEQLPEFKMNIAVHFGNMFLGNYGTKNALKYGVVGDLLNTTKRIRDLCPFFGVGILCTEVVQNLVGKSEAGIHIWPLLKVNMEKRTGTGSGASGSARSSGTSPTTANAATGTATANTPTSTATEGHSASGTNHSGGSIVVCRVEGSPTAAQVSAMSDYAVVYAAFYNTATNWKNSENLTKLDVMISAFLRQHPGELAALHLKKKIFARELGRATPISKLRAP